MYNYSDSLTEIAKAASATSIINKIPSSLSLSSYIQEFNKAAFVSAINMSKSIKKFGADMIKAPSISAVDMSKIKAPSISAVDMSKIGDQMSKIAQSANMLNNRSFFNDFVKKITDHKFRF